ncbi:PQQ-binding-like beta-propeller repeat protein [Micromonospora sp. DR5-3]|uniref:outer membrane protein assembly factor BamB family protein n=1 Tax=unclassified Micromonospora TaxID=2617518 RepID=UPI0011D4D83B|nr:MULTISPECIES: PQQ-binding-like beta-propeller repeat protein [unclassified Micromonospora]MCW3813300.1 PQQ-binding-like beta-propeller repeat protein [Micromonospora sp. DR5-3]TYC24688.1 PQQ-binding-like beta-propeller repeat protein [Micromonospora sp. MP36]
MTIIDLGELRHDPEPQPPPRPPRAVTRPYRVLAVLAAVLCVLAGGVPRPERAVAVVSARLGADLFLVADRLYVVDPLDPQQGTGRQLVAYRLPADGPPAVLWRTSLPAGGGDVWLLQQGATVLVSGRQVGGPEGVFRTTALDAGTGRSGWQQPGAGYPAGDGVLLQNLDASGEGSLRRVDVASGRTLWSVPTPLDGPALRFGPDGVDRIVLAAPSGEVEVRDPASGALLAARNIRPGQLPSWQRNQVVGDLLLVISDNGGTVTGYGLDRLDQRWTARLAQVGYLTDCGDLLCAYRQTGGMWALDPATGAVRWSNPRWQAVLWAERGRFLVGADDSGGSRFLVADAATGQPVADLGSWELASWTEPGDRLIGVRRGGDGRLLVAELDVAAARVRVFDALPNVLGDCRTGRDVLVCRRNAGGFGVWRLP